MDGATRGLDRAWTVNLQRCSRRVPTAVNSPVTKVASVASSDARWLIFVAAVFPKYRTILRELCGGVANLRRCRHLRSAEVTSRRFGIIE